MSIFQKIKLHSLVLMICVSLSCSFAVAENVEFSWAFYIENETGMQQIDYNSVANVGKKSTLQIYTDFQTNCYFYLYLYSSNREVVPLHPSAIVEVGALSVVGKYFIPSQNERFEITPPGGQERFYMLVSPVPLLDLETYTRAVLKNPSDKQRGVQLYQEIRRLRRESSTLTQATEKGVPVTGTFQTRGAKKGASQSGIIQVSSEGLYSKIIRLNHE